MYAIIRTGGKQSKVREGDVIDIERVKQESGELSFTPLLLVSEDGSVVSDRSALEAASVTAEVVGENRGPKIDVFKYKNKTGYRRRQGHRQHYTTIKVTGISGGKAAKAKTSAAKSAASESDADSTDGAEEA